MAINKHPLSPLIHSELLQISEVVFWDRTRLPDIEERDDDQPYVVRRGERLDNLAYTQLGSEHLGWVILARNGKALWPNDLVPGDRIFIPSIEGLKERGII